MATQTISFRDPIHGDILLRLPEDAVVLAIIDAPDFQRLRRIRQLALASMVFHGAEHSRFTHSLGTFWVMRRALQHLAETSSPAVRSLIDEHRRAAELAALLHDVGHGPFSHAFEKVLTSQDHEETANMLLREDTSIRRALLAHGVDPEAIIALHEGRGPRFLTQLLSSHLDADRMDYLLRDAHMTGAQLGSYDLERLIHGLLVADEDGAPTLAVDGKAIAAAESLLLARSFMHQHVYHHKAIESAEALLAATLRRAADAARAGLITVEHAGLAAVILENRLDVAFFEELDDSLLTEHFRAWKRGADPVLADLCDRILNRRLLKALRLVEPLSPELHARVDALASEAGFDPTAYVHDVSWVLTPLPEAKSATDAIRIRIGSALVPLTTASDFLRPLAGKSFSKRLLLIPSEIRAAVRALVRG